MKQFMIDMMIMMMPVMKPLVWLGFALVIVGAILMVMRQILDDKNGSMVLLAGRILLGLAGFFLACQVAGTFLGMPPKINFGDFEKMEFILGSLLANRPGVPDCSPDLRLCRRAPSPGTRGGQSLILAVIIVRGIYEFDCPGFNRNGCHPAACSSCETRLRHDGSIAQREYCQHLGKIPAKCEIPCAGKWIPVTSTGMTIYLLGGSDCPVFSRTVVSAGHDGSV